MGDPIARGISQPSTSWRREEGSRKKAVKREVHGERGAECEPALVKVMTERTRTVHMPAGRTHWGASATSSAPATRGSSRAQEAPGGGKGHARSQPPLGQGTERTLPR